ncbi:MAG: trypsin-like peptidase domain-containing protein [Planctomycetota bacterium]|nr:trypsin-like peptidase domain-containing protein [Planctomycetota bacterium]MDA1164102.1 trypsin-like peptidase domain-containing protein [Planctomycetota bacterium]
MKTTRSMLLCGFGIALGFGFGAGLSLQGPAGSAQADYLNEAESEKIYRELDAGDSSLADTSRVLSKIARVVMPGVVHINSFRKLPPRGRVEETGSGVVMSSLKRPGTYIVTNRHVINDALPDLESISIHLSDGRVIHPLKVWEDRYSDIAVLEVEAVNLEPLRWGDSDKLEIGNIVLACGSPFGLSQSVTMGIVSARGRSSLGIGNRSVVLNQDFIQTDAAINPGNSGGPLIGLQGKLLGINTAIASTHGGNEGIGFSIPSNLVRHVVSHLLEYGSVRRAYLGVKLDSEFDYEAAQQLSLYRSRGARILEVYPNTPAAQADLKYNDVILEFNGVEVLDESHLINRVSLSDVGELVEVTVWRDGKKVKIKVDLTGRPARSE